MPPVIQTDHEVVSQFVTTFSRNGHGTMSRKNVKAYITLLALSAKSGVQEKVYKTICVSLSVSGWELLLNFILT